MYANIVFMQGDDADEAFANADSMKQDFPSWEDALLNYLGRWDYGDESECDVHPGPSYGTYDNVYESGDYVLSWSRSFGTCGLERKIRD